MFFILTTNQDNLLNILLLEFENGEDAEQFNSITIFQFHIYPAILFKSILIQNIGKSGHLT